MESSMTPPIAQGPFAKILVPVDGSEASIRAARVAIDMASVHQLPLIVLYVVDDQGIQRMVRVSGRSEETIRRQMESKGWSYLEHVAEMARSHGVHCDKMIRRGVVHAQITDVVRARGVDLVVIGSRERQRSQRAFIGSLTEHVIEYVPCSVLVVKPD
jgi:nucleotide-binding universal stress UspA family protein